MKNPGCLLCCSGFLLTALLLSFIQAEQTRYLREEKERMEDQSQAKDAFLTTISHELRTPIHAITGVADLLGRNSAISGTIGVSGEIIILITTLTPLQLLLLDLSRIEAGRLNWKPRFSGWMRSCANCARCSVCPPSKKACCFRCYKLCLTLYKCTATPCG